jgi:hypothetical protein
MSEQEVTEILEQAKKPGTFNILNVLKDRAYPETDVTVYLDEKAAYLAAEMNEKVKLALAELESGEENKELEDKLENLEESREVLISKLKDSAYTFKIVGISEGTREDVIKKCEEKYPTQYTESKNPITGEAIKSEVPDENRAEMLMNLIWQSHIVSITSPDGEVQEGISIEDASEIRRALPIASSAIISQAIEKIRTATVMFMLTVDEDFLAKS